MDVRRCARREDFLALVNGPEFTMRWMLERHLATRHRGEASFGVPGVCPLCGVAVDFDVRFEGAWQAPDGLLVPNWREFMNCPQCGMNARQRMMLDLARQHVRARSGVASAYLMEQITPVYAWVVAALPEVRWVGSEFLGRDVPPGSTRDGIRHEDAERLSFASATFDLVVSADVLEHVDDPARALSEIARTLRPGGAAILFFPMDPQLDANRRRARIRADGTVEHLLAPEVHRNPLSPEGSLVFTDFGWQVLDDMRSVGFGDASLNVYWSYERGYLGIQFYFSATRR